MRTTWLMTLVAVTALSRPASAASAPASAATAVTQSVFGRLPDGRAIDCFALRNANGATAEVITYGAIVADLQMPDRAGHCASVVRKITFSPEALAQHFPQSARVVGRVANRIAHARFTLDGREYVVAANAAPHHIHSGPQGFDRVLWTGEVTKRPDGPAVTLTYLSPDGDQGYPGNLRVAITYTLTDDNRLRIEYVGTTDRPTLLNPTSHGFFNLAGGGDIHDQVLELNADRYTEVDEDKIPTGALPAVAGTAFDFRQPAPIADRHAPGRPNFDHNFVLRRSTADGLEFAARLFDPNSGRTMEVWTTEPGLQLLTSRPANSPDRRRGSVCLEAQHFPDSIHHPHFPSIIVRPGQPFRSTTEYRFSVR